MGRIITLLIVLPILFLGAVLAASELGGEVVELETQDANGRTYLTSVWVIDIERSAWIRAGDVDSDWVARLRANPEVTMTRGGEQTIYRAEVRRDSVDRVNTEMRKKYGFADRVVTLVHDAGNVVAIRLIRR